MDVIYSNTISLLSYLILIYFIYITVDLTGFIIKSNLISSYEQIYLLNLKTYAVEFLNNKVGKAHMFVNLYVGLMGMNFNLNSSGLICNESRYYCTNSSYEYMSNLIENQYEVIMRSYKNLIKDECIN
jgi:cytochrome b subunit of formate dehydrogenase